MKREELDDILGAVVSKAIEAAMSGVEGKIQAAIHLGASIGATAGAEAGAQAAIRAAERERHRYRQAMYDARYHNTKLLLKNYRALNAHYKHAVFDMQTGEAENASFAEIMAAMNSTIADEALYIESIKESVVRTKIIMTHVNRMIEVYKELCEHSERTEDKRHWRVLYTMYITDEPLSAEEIAAQESIDKRTVYKDIDAAATDLTTLFFGVGALNN